MQTDAIIQARMGSTRLPGKVMLPLDGEHVLSHVIRRVNAATQIDNVLVATSTEGADDIIASYARWTGADVYRGDEYDVLSRVYETAKQNDSDQIVRVTADCPLLSPRVLDTAIETLEADESSDYVSTTIDRTFPRGVDAEVFTMDSFATVHAEADKPPYREHVTPLYRERPEQFTIRNVESSDVFDQSDLQRRSELRLTLDEPDDYELLRLVYDNVQYNGVIDYEAAIKFIDRTGIATVNADVEQKAVTDTDIERGNNP